MRLPLALLALLVGCGSSGDGPQDAPDPCPTGDCTLPGRTTIKWTLDAYPEWSFPQDSCTDLGVGMVQVDLVDANGTPATTTTAACGNGQAVFSGLAAGDYTVAVMPLDAGGLPMQTTAVMGTVTAGTSGNDQEVTINMPWDGWINAASLTGTFLFRITWGGVTCGATTITKQTVKLTVDGVVQTMMTDDGQKLDGTDKRMCKMSTDMFPQSALDVKFGPATIEIQGFDMADSMVYTQSFDTFVGAGITNPTLTFDVPTM